MSFFQVKKFFDANAFLVALSTLLLLGLVVLLSMRLRATEMETMFKLGCSRGTIALLQVGELLFVFVLAVVLVAAALWCVTLFAGDVVQSLLVG